MARPSKDARFAVDPGSLTQRWLAPLTVAVVAAGLYLPSLSGDFVSLDDDFNFVNNIDFRGFGPTQWRWALSGPHFGNYEPFHWLLQGLTYSLFGFNVRAFHAVSVALLVCVAVALYFLLLRVINLICVPRSEEHRAASCCAAAGALWFAVNPLRVECVSWASGQHYLSAGLFFILSLGAYLSGARGRAVALFAVSLLFFPCALALPLVLAAWDATIAPAVADRKHRAILRSTWFFAIPTLLAGMGLLRSRARMNLLIPEPSLGKVDLLMAPFLNTALQFERSLFPIGLHPVYLRLTGAAAAPHFIFGAALLAMIIIALRRESRLAGLAACGLVSMLPVVFFSYKKNNFADRYCFLPGIFLAAALATAFFESLRRWPHRRTILWASVGGVVVSLAALNWQQQRMWHRSESLWQHVLAVDPDNAFAYHSLGRIRQRSGRPAEAIPLFEKALAATVPYLSSRINLANSYLEIGAAAQAEREYRGVIADFPDSPVGYNGLGVCYALRGRPHEAVAQFKHALEIDPNYHNAYAGIAKALEDSGELEGASEAYVTAVGHEPRNLDDWDGLGRVAIRRRHLSEAEEAFRTVLNQAPERFETHNNMGICLMLQGRSNEALVEFNRALGINPNYQPARKNIGLILGESTKRRAIPGH